MKLYFRPGACSLSPHIALREADLPFALEYVDQATRRLRDGRDYTRINPKGQVPCFELASGETITEGPAIVQYIADQVPEKKLAPAPGTLARVRLQEWLNFITSELHKSFSPLFASDTPEACRAIASKRVTDRFVLADAALVQTPYLLGEDFTVADGYLFVVAGWSRYVGIDLGRFEHLGRFLQRVGARPAVEQALAAERG
jgi:glutathione S-transferase